MDAAYWHEVSVYLTLQCALAAGCILVLVRGALLWKRHAHALPSDQRPLLLTAGVILSIIVLTFINRFELTLPSLVQAAVLLTGVGAWYWTCRRPAFQARHMQNLSAADLGWFRMVVCVSLLVLAVKDDLRSTLLLPTELIEHLGPVGYLVTHAAPLLDVRSGAFLLTLQTATIITLLCGAFGLLTRLTLPLAAALFTLFYYVQMMYTYFYHSGFLSLELLYALCFMRCGDGWSFDAWWRRRRRLAKATGIEVSPAAVAAPSVSAPAEPYSYGAAVYTLTAMYGLTYFIASLNKWGRDPFWALPQNFMRLLLPDSLALVDHYLHLDLVMDYVRAGAPDIGFSLMAMAGLLSETAGILLVLERSSWRLVAPLLFVLHTGIFVAQKFIFPELAILPFMLLTPFAWRARKDAPALSASSPVPMRQLLLFAAYAGLISVGWILRWEIFPVATRWAMYSSSSSSDEIRYNLLFARLRSGARQRVDLTDQIDFLSVGRWQDAATFPHLDKKGKRRPKTVKNLQLLLRNYANLHNHDASDSEQIVGFEYEVVKWNFVKDRADPNYGQVVDRFTFNL